MSQMKPNGGERVPTSEFELLQKVRNKMNQLYVALDAFKADLVSDSADLINQQIRVLGQMIEQHQMDLPKDSEHQHTDRN